MKNLIFTEFTDDLAMGLPLEADAVISVFEGPQSLIAKVDRILGRLP
jgi:hypothetical protein